MIFVILGTLFILWMIQNFYWKRKNLPPGPIPYPILGNFPFLSKYGFENSFDIIKKQYGDIHTIWLGERPMVMICDVPTIIDTFIKDSETYSGRPLNQKITELRTKGRYGLIFNDGEIWRHHRRATLHVFRDFGMGKNLMQEKVLDEARIMIETLRQESKFQKNVEIQQKIDLAVGNIINTLLFGYRFEGKKLQEFTRLKQLLQNHIRSVGSPFMRTLNFNPWVWKFMPNFFLNDFRRKVDEMRMFFDKQIKEHELQIDFETESDPTDFVEYYLKKQKKLTKDDSESDLYSDEQLFGSCVDLWLAGQETTSNTIAWGVIYMIYHSEIQKKLHNEMDTVIGTDRWITLNDKSKLNYLNAIIAEIQRCCNLVPLNVVHRVTKDVTIQGYFIPKDTSITHHIGTVLKDERYFPEPEKFKPERFLNKNGKFIQPQELMPFGVGKRSCLGEGLAKLELFLFLGNLFNHFEITKDPQNPPDLTRIIGGTVQPEPFVCRIKSRF